MAASRTLSHRRASLAARRAEGFSSLSHLIDSVCVDLEETKELCKKEGVSPIRIKTIRPVEFTKARKYVEGKAGLEGERNKSCRDLKQNYREMRDLLSFSKQPECSASTYLSRDRMSNPDVREALRKYKRKFGESSVLQAQGPREPHRIPTYLLNRPLFQQTTSHKEQLDRFIGKYIDSHLRRKPSMIKFVSQSALPSPHLTPLTSPIRSEVSSPKGPICHKHDTNLLKTKLRKLHKNHKSDGVDFDGDSNLLNEIRESSCLLFKDQSKIKNFTKDKFKQLRTSGRHLIL